MSSMVEKLTKRQKLHQQINLIESVLQDHDNTEETQAYKPWLEESLKFCLEAMKELIDENDSVWDMIEEIRAAEIANHSEEFRQMMDRKLTEIKMLAAMKPGLA